MLKKAFDFFIFTSLFIATCAVAMVYQASLLFRVHFPLSLYAFVFFGSVCSYNFHWSLAPPGTPAQSSKLGWNLSHHSLHLILAAAGAAGAAVCSLLLIEHWVWLAPTAFFTFLYSAPMIRHPWTLWMRRIAVGKTVYLAAAWTHVTAFLPLIIALKSLAAPHILYVANRLFFLYAVCIVFDRRDVEQDRRAGIKSLITFLSAKGVDRLFWASCALVLFSSVWLGRWLSWVDVAALVVPAFILSFLYESSRQSKSDYLYYFLLDGLMALSAPILLLLRFAR